MERKDVMNHILIVGNSRTILDALSSFLGFRFREYSIVAAEDEQQAIRMLETYQMNLILVDIDMPQVTEGSFILSAKKKYPTVPVIIMIGSLMRDLPAITEKMNRIYSIQKPFRFDDLALMITELLATGKSPDHREHRFTVFPAPGHGCTDPGLQKHSNT
ncbi:MAG: response regulator [Nitrospirota bacterium]